MILLTIIRLKHYILMLIIKGDHARLAQTIQKKINHNWVLSYDGIPQIVDLYSDRRYFLYNLQYSAAKAYKGQRDIHLL